MGIPHLMRHLLPYSENIVLERKQEQASREGTEIRSVVIDGPSLVYHVFERLLSSSNPRFSILDAQPTCNEVSTGVMFYLLQLLLLGIKIEKIFFDGALPETKRETRIGRLERSRKKLEQFCLKYSIGPADSLYNGNPIEPRRISRGRPMPVKFNCLPENPFMVSSVFEDLRKRWCKESIRSAAQAFFCLGILEAEKDFPWAETTIMVPSEADIECARVTKLTGSAVLTNDSDLLLHDLGSYGSVLFLGSVELNEWDVSGPTEYKLKGRRLCPASLAYRLGIKNIRHFAYELSYNPQLGLSELIRRSKDHWGLIESNPDYHRFAREYDFLLDEQKLQLSMIRLPQDLDPRISELFIQYELENSRLSNNVADIYLAVLNEDHARRCAWDEGRLYRTLGYSILNLSYSASKRLIFVDEFLRRGRRISKERISLGDEDWIAAELRLLCERLNAAQLAFDGDVSSPSFWRLFALCHLYGFGTTDPLLPDVEQLYRFLKFGHMGRMFEWEDVHLCTQIHAVLYSLRILKQLMELVSVSNELLLKTRSIIVALPPLHITARPRREMTQELGNMPYEETVRRLLKFFGQFYEACDKTTQPLHPRRDGTMLQSKGKPEGIKNAHCGGSNLYELLPTE